MDLKEALIKTLRAEVKPAIGCTEPVAIALAVARAKEASGIEKSSNIEKIHVRLSNNVYKNTMGVGIPGTRLAGIDVAIALGAVACQSSDGLTVFSRVCEEGIAEALRLMERRAIDAVAIRTDNSMHVEAEVFGKSGESSAPVFGRAIIIGKHDNFTLVENHEGILLENAFVTVACAEHDLAGYKIADIIRGIEELPYEEITFLKDGVDMNLAIAEYGLDNECGLKVGKKLQESGDFSDCYMKNAMMLTAAAADARMDGAPLPVMSSSGSGNNGLTSIIPVAVYCQKNNIDDDRLCRAIAISHITNTIIKQKIGRLSALCGCAISAGSGAAAALSWLKGGTVEQVEGTIQNMIANTSGMICDGAKTGCALKLATSVSAAFLSSTLAMEGITVPVGNGIIGNQADESIANLGNFADSTKSSMDDSILDIMQRTNAKK
ncbi:MAG: L-serine ammonia-lyase, iron-sulfur-dependent, subunit alpha [Bacillota bacterium]|nr:L-serine ammonia-lyase, iron-sulfur-dependent, subunit alpha [Bacillota bacterium]